MIKTLLQLGLIAHQRLRSSRTATGTTDATEQTPLLVDTQLGAQQIAGNTDTHSRELRTPLATENRNTHTSQPNMQPTTDDTNTQIPQPSTQPAADDNNFFYRLKNIAELVATIPVTNFWWYFCNAHWDIGNLSNVRNNTTDTEFLDSWLTQSASVGDYRIALFIVYMVQLDHVLASNIKIERGQVNTLPHLDPQIFPKNDINRQAFWEAVQSTALALKYYCGAAGWTALTLLVLDETLVTRTFFSGLGTMMGIAFAGNLSLAVESALLTSGPDKVTKVIGHNPKNKTSWFSQTRKQHYAFLRPSEPFVQQRVITSKPEEISWKKAFAATLPSDTISRLMLAGLLEGMAWTLMEEALEGQDAIPDYIGAALLGLATYVAFCIGYALKPSPTPIQFFQKLPLLRSTSNNQLSMFAGHDNCNPTPTLRRSDSEHTHMKQSQTYWIALDCRASLAMTEEVITMPGSICNDGEGNHNTQ